MEHHKTGDAPHAPAIAMQVKPHEPPERPVPWLEPVAVVVMALASIGSAWCSYQSSRWSSESNTLATEAAKREREAQAWHVESQQVQSLHVRLAAEAIDAHMAGNEKTERFYTDRFQDELRVAWDRWMALKPFENPAAAPHPFVPGLYTPRYQQQIHDAKIEAVAAESGGATASQHAGSCLRITVALATVLLFAGTAGKFERRRVRLASLGFAVILFIYSGLRVLMLPVI